MTRRPDSEEPEQHGGHAAERLRDFLRRRSIEGHEEQPPASEEPPEPEPEPEQDTAEDDDGR
jgi:hypothetical protein